MSKRLASTFFTALALLHVPGYSLWRLTRTHLEIAAVSLLEPPRASRQGLDALTSKHTTNTKRNVPKIYSEKQRPAKGFHKHLLYAGFATYLYIHIYIYSWRTLIAMALVASLLLVAMPGAPNSVLFLVVRPGAPSSVLITSSSALVTFLRQDALAKMRFLRLSRAKELLLQRAYIYIYIRIIWQPARWLCHLDSGNQLIGFPTPLRWQPACWLIPTSTMMAAIVLALPSGQWQPACWLTHFNYDGSQRAGFAISTMAASVLADTLQTMMVASVLAHTHFTHFNYDGSQRAGFAIWTMAASVLAYPLQL